MKSFTKENRRNTFSFLTLIIIFSVLVFTGCTPVKEENLTQEENKSELYKKEGYYNRFPIQIIIDKNFGDYYVDLIKSSLDEFDKELDGITFQYPKNFSGTIKQDYSYIYINYDKNGTNGTAQSFSEVRKGDKYAYAQLPIYKYKSIHGNVSTFTSEVFIGSYFTIIEDVSNSNLGMMFAFKYANYGDFYTPITTTYSKFKSRLISALKGLVKHEVSHSLGFIGDNKNGCNGAVSTPCHSSDNNSLMYPSLNPDKPQGKNVVTEDIKAYFNKKYPA